MTNPYRALCAELADVVYEYCILHEGRDHLQPLVDRARALLAQPVAEGPTDEEIMELMPQQMRDDLAAAARALTDDMPWPDNPKAAVAMRIILNRHAVGHARAVLAKYGTPTPQPVPLSERLPSAADCDVEDNCWWFDPHADGAWYVDTFQSCYTHWLPANALPTPEAQ